MLQPLIDHIRKFVPLTDAEAAVVLSVVTHRVCKKKELLHKSGAPCQERYFVLTGCLRSYFVSGEEDEEQLLQFAIENWWMSDWGSFGTPQPSALFIQALEPATVAVLTAPAMEELLQRVPVLERYFRLVTEKAYYASVMRNHYMLSFSVEERYRHFRDAFPEFLQRVPQYMLASYLGFTPEFLSRMRARGV
jgi:CRP-like cAMP-binding protein